MSEKNDTPVYMATVTPGLEHIAVKEMRGKFPAIGLSKGPLRGKVFFTYPATFEDLYALKCVDNLYLSLESFGVGPHKADLAGLSEKIRGSDIANKLLQIRPEAERRRIILSASRSGKHSYSRFDAAAAALNALLEDRGFLPGTVEGHDLALRLDIDRDRASLYVKLTPAAFRFRHADKEFLTGALKSSVAHAMVLLSEPEPSDVFLDPFCGSGTIPFERAFYGAYAIMASDASPERVRAAGENLPDFVGVNCWDARHTELPDRSVTKIVSNPPWGRQIQAGDIHGLYIDFLREAKRILADGGKMVLLTSEEAALIAGAGISEFKIDRACGLSLHGLHPSLFVLTR